MQVSLFNGNRPPYVRFEKRPVEDRNASIEKGIYVTKDVDFALITPAGSRDVVEKIVSEWFTQLQQFVREERFPAQWLDYYKAQYKSWKEGDESPLQGTDIRNWPVLGPSMLTLCREIGVRTVEDLAQANEETIARLGMGGRDAVTKAAQWVAGGNAEKIEANNRIAALEQELAAMRAMQAQQAASQEAVVQKTSKGEDVSKSTKL